MWSHNYYTPPLGTGMVSSRMYSSDELDAWDKVQPLPWIVTSYPAHVHVPYSTALQEAVYLMTAQAPENYNSQKYKIYLRILHVCNGSSSSCKGSGGQPEFQDFIASQCQDNPYIDRTKRSLCKGHWIFMGNQFFIGRRIAVELVWCRIGSNPLMGRGGGGTEIPVVCHHSCTQRYLCKGHYR